MAILIIDDVPVTRKIIESFLKDGGHTDIIQADSAENAFQILGLYADSDTPRQSIDLILMDIVLQGVDGIEACRLIKNDQRSAHIPIVIITAYTSAEHIETAFKAGAIHDTIKRESDFIARYGGEEFVIVLFGVEPKTAAELAENIREHIFGLKIPHSASPVSDWVTVSIGVVSCIPEPSVSPESMIDRADKALYTAKSHGKNQVVQFELSGI